MDSNSYSDEELAELLLEAIRSNEELKEELSKAIRRKKRHWLANLIIDTARFLFGASGAAVVERIVDWIIDRFLLC